ncbi:TlpA family protein disulfide reductase [Mucilaginibacter pallidiroseus]|uniref:TlpA family protein disulfide reductase n=1 Tax=Mucilaginibacter pallidiroseus TaxID=2599295 RepID=A0A563UF17_9SPHI|nr:TlpA disulfide reductase family protein [Mucilaginibacter pallidiroseus]TWR29948.1 TlpA family protein disulfide reductase [Mucilaginibacter pallidiroseus]
MKHLLLLIWLLVSASLAFAQFKIFGDIRGGKMPDSVYINIPFVYGYHTENTFGIAVNKNGSFSSIIAVKNKRFGTININRKMFTLLLTPGKSLYLNIKGADTTIAGFKGSYRAENQFVSSLGFEEVPFFFTDTTFSKLTLPQLKEQMISRWFAMRDKNLNRVQASDLSPFDKRLISQEISANAILKLNDFARTTLATGRPQVFELVEEVYKGAELHANVLPAGPQYYAFANSYISYLETMAIKGFPLGALKDPKTFIKYFDITIREGDSIIKNKGKQYLNWTVARKQFGKAEGENWLAQAIEDKYLTKDLYQAKPLYTDFKRYYPQSIYLPEFEAKINRLEKALAENMTNKEIVVANDYETITSIYDVVKTLKGKVVYLDIWGTWCGPCKHELKYVPELKKHFKNKDVAYIYLDMDADDKDSQWRDFIRINGMTGVHLRKSSQAIQAFWNELMPAGGTRYYPTYFIFDKQGNLVQADAKRPSNRAELYEQIEKYL